LKQKIDAGRRGTKREIKNFKAKLGKITACFVSVRIKAKNWSKTENL